MHICLYGHFSFPSSKGTPLRLLAQARALVSKGHEVTILAKSGQELDDVTFVELGETGWIGPRGLSNGAVRALPTATKFLREANPDLVHAHVLESGPLCAVAAKLSRTPFVYEPHGDRVAELTEQGTIAEDSFAESYVRRIENIVLRASDGLVTLTEAQFRDARERVRYDGPASVVVGGCPDEFLDSSEALDLGDGPVVAYAGNLRARQGIPKFLDLVDRVLAERTDFTPALITHQSDTEHVDDLLADRGLTDAVSVHTEVDSDDLPRYLDSTDVLVAPTPDTHLNRYRYPSKVTLYLGSDAAVMATDIPPQRRVIEDGETGLLYGNVEEGADHLKSLLADPARREQIATASTQYVDQNLKWDHLAEELEDLYAEVTA